MTDPVMRSLWEDPVDLPVQQEEHSIEAARNAVVSAKGVRRAILRYINRNGPATCEELHHLHPTGKHQSVSGALTLMRQKGVLWKVGERKNGAGNTEWVNDITAAVRNEFGLGPGLPEVKSGR